MTCQDLTNDLLLDYAEWQLAPSERNRIARHLEVCEGCRARRDDLEGMTGALRGSGEAPPAALMAQLDRAVLASVPRTNPAAAARPSPPGRSFRLLLAASGVAALLAVAAVAFFAGERIGRTRVSEVATKTILVPAPRIVDETPKEPPPEPKPVRTVVPHESKTVEPAPERIPPPAPAPEPKPEPKPAPAIAAADPPPPAPRLRGDLNGDGVLDIADARILQQMIEQGLPLPEYADANGDGVVDIADVLAIMRAELALR